MPRKRKVESNKTDQKSKKITKSEASELYWADDQFKPITLFIEEESENLLNGVNLILSDFSTFKSFSDEFIPKINETLSEAVKNGYTDLMGNEVDSLEPFKKFNFKIDKIVRIRTHAEFIVKLFEKYKKCELNSDKVHTSKLIFTHLMLMFK